MTAAAIAAIAVCLLALALLLRPRVMRSDTWRATATPLASIIGSGFLVTVPILRDLAGAWAAIAMAGLLALSYLIGAAIRENIGHIELLLAERSPPAAIARLEHASNAVLAFAYFVSVAYYLALFASFALRPFALDRWLEVNLLVSALLVGIGLIGLIRGFRAVERLEVYAVTAKLAVIAGLLAALAVYAVGVLAGGRGHPPPAGHFELSSVPLLLGLLITVQGFETSRFLGAAYDQALRIRTMRLAQLIAAGIYLLFFLGMVPVMGFNGTAHGVAAIVDMLAPVSLVLPALVIAGALASQSSAAIADTLGAGGLLQSLSGGRLAENRTYPMIALVAGIVVWSTDIYSLIALASRCFALYYGLQCALAAISATRRGRPAMAGGFVLLAGVCAAVVIFGASVEGE